MKISFVVALTRKGVMGKNNALPWHLPEDLKRFKQLTLGKPILMGRKTYESIGRPLPGRRNIVMSRNKDLKIEGIECVTTFDEAKARSAGSEELCIIGGAEIFKITVQNADVLHITWIETNFDGDILFPKDFPWKDFKEVENEKHLDNKIPHTNTTYHRVTKGA